MNRPIIDSHVHLDMYLEEEQNRILQDLEYSETEALISVSSHLTSARKNKKLAEQDSRVKPAFGFHPEQELPDDDEIQDLLAFVNENADNMVAIGEVGLPYYLRKENEEITLAPYLELLETFIEQAALLKKPVILHAIYEDAPLVCDLLEKHSVSDAHFHWFKGPAATVERMMQNGYYLSVTPDCVYEAEIQELLRQVPLTQLMVETDGPWPFAGPFSKHMTHPSMIHKSLALIADINRIALDEVYTQIYQNTKIFYRL